ncbi:MAG: thioredoxin domain-containing protein, partial [Candidatus Saccharicenans sp.]|nr:thioredoxin domain-containing protein [Candidatus Saccharicenans sp.]
PIRIVEYADFLCPDCLFLFKQLEQLKKEYEGKINIAFQFFPLEAKCNEVVEKDLHPGACELSYIAAYNPSKFLQIHDEIFQNFEKAKDPAWRLELAKKYGVEAALTDDRTKELVKQIIETGKEYQKTSDRYSYGIRSTPTMIINNRMIIGTLPYAHLKAIIESLLAEQEEPETGQTRFLENWVDTRQIKK